MYAVFHSTYCKKPIRRRQIHRSGTSSNSGKVRNKANKRSVNRKLEFDAKRKMNSALPGDAVFGHEQATKNTKSSWESKSREASTKEKKSREKVAKSKDELVKNNLCSTVMDNLDTNVISPKVDPNQNLSFNTSCTDKSNTSKISATSTPRVSSGQKNIRQQSKIPVPIKKVNSRGSMNSLGITGLSIIANTKLDANVEESQWDVSSKPETNQDITPKAHDKPIFEKTKVTETTSVDSKESKDKKPNNFANTAKQKFKSLKNSVKKNPLSRKKSNERLLDDDKNSPKIAAKNVKNKVKSSSSRSDSYEQAIHNSGK